MPLAVRALLLALVYFVLRAQPWAAPAAGRIDTITPAMATAGQVVTITGIGFGARNVRVTVGGIPATIVSATGNTVRFIVPPGLPPGPTTVAATNPGGHTGTIAFRVAGGVPVANAGPDQTVYVSDQVLLNGAGSTDPDGDPLTYQWTLTAPGGSFATLSSPTAVNPTFVVDLPGTYVASLIVSDGTSNSAPDEVRIDTTNSKPIANAGLDQTVAVGTIASLDGSASVDVDGNPLTFEWTLVSQPAGSSASIANPFSPTTPIAIDRAGTYEISLVVNDGLLASDPDIVVINTLNSAPVADAGADQFVNAEAGPVTIQLDGSASFDADGDALTYDWSFTAFPGPAAPGLLSAIPSQPLFIAETPGLYVAQLIVSDGALASLGDTVTIVVNSPPAVTATASPATVYLPDVTTLMATVTDDGQPAPPNTTVSWTGSGPGTVTIENVNELITTASFSTFGPYVFTLTASDGQASTTTQVAVDVHRNYCAENNGGCDPLTPCTNTPDGAMCGVCPPGYQGSGAAGCQDIDECGVNNGGCGAHVICTNTPGGFECGACAPGYAPDGAGQCVDINECATNNGGCGAGVGCANTDGGFTCSAACLPGFTGTPATGCTDINECAVNNGGCNALALCTNTPGSRTCQCPRGFSGDGVTCTDINECLTNNGGCSPLVTCSNTPGSRTCGACPAGYTGTGTTGCNDIDECQFNNGGCDPGVQCTNLPGGRMCGDVCPAGYTSDGQGGCTDVNECATLNGGCDPRTACINLPGSRTCGACPSGFSGDGVTGCVEVNECLTNNGGCSSLVTCTNTIGSRICGPCPRGFTGNGETCTDINECLINNGACDPLVVCINTPGSRVCGPCPSGYTGTGTTGCNDINECAINNGGCAANEVCTNTPGSRTCSPAEDLMADGAPPAPEPSERDPFEVEWLAVLPAAPRIAVRGNRRREARV